MISASDLIDELGLQRHPEGGWFVETFRSPNTVTTDDGRVRSASTAIFFLLERGDFSAWHSVASDEAWMFHAGAPLALHLLDETDHREIWLGADVATGQRPQFVVPAGVLQAAHSTGEWTLVSCTVAPGFDFADFEMPDRDTLQQQFPQHPDAVERFTRVD